jgi:hypothetical protein
MHRTLVVRFCVRRTRQRPQRISKRCGCPCRESGPRRDAYDTLGSATCVTLKPSEKYHRRPACATGMTAGNLRTARRARSAFQALSLPLPGIGNTGTTPIVAWARSASEKRPSKEASRRVRFDRAQLGQKSYNMKFFKFRIRNFVTPIIESVRTPARITPYPTGRLFWGGAVPGTSCQATIAPSLRDISQQALARHGSNDGKIVIFGADFRFGGRAFVIGAIGTSAGTVESANWLTKHELKLPKDLL